jgi:ketosteroid isomerase-like protein
MSDIDTSALEQVVAGIGDHEIVILEARVRAAQLHADLPALTELISDDLLFTGPDGQLGTKAQDMEAYRSGVVKFLEHVPQELRIRRVGSNVAIASLRAQLTVAVAGNISRGTYRYTRVWAREDDDRWRIVGGHVSSVTALDGGESSQHETTS